MLPPDDPSPSESAIVDALAGARILAFPKEEAGASSEQRAQKAKKSRKSRAQPDGDGAKGLTGGTFSLEKFNDEWAFCLVGKNAVVLREKDSGPTNERVRILTLDAFKSFNANRYELVEDDAGKFKRRLFSTYWLSHRDRRTYDGIEFFPDPDMKTGSENYFNLWRGFAVEPSLDPPKVRAAKYSVFADHLITNVCDGDKKLRDWVFGWMAHLVQKPRERVGTAIVLRGEEGWGKSKIGEVIGSLFPSHYMQIDQPHHLTGNFNAHMVSCLLLQIEEGFWAGDKSAEGRLKSLITSSRQMIEAKGVDAIMLDNYVNLIFTSNESWVVPVGLGGRRYCVIDVKGYAARSASYFGEMDEQLANGGREALLADLLAFDLSRVDLRDVPKTAALLEQKQRSMDPLTSWWFDRLMDGAITRRATRWYTAVPIDRAYNDYLHAADQVGARRKLDKTAFGMAVNALVPGLQNSKRTMDVEEFDEIARAKVRRKKRVRCWIFPGLAECRAAFDEKAQQPNAWPEVDQETNSDTVYNPDDSDTEGTTF